MKRLATLVAIIATSMASIAQSTTENFNSRFNVGLSQVKSTLQSQCWQFTDFDVNNGGWNANIEGDGAMVSGAGISATQNTGIYSQVLSFYGSLNVSFKYKFNSDVTSRRWIKVYVTDGNNNTLDLLDSLELTGANANTVYNYNKTFGVGSGCYKIFINYQGIGGSTRIAIDELSYGTTTCYSSGCNQPPVADNDYFNGNNNRTGAGNVMPNDSDPDNEVLTASLVSNSADGNVVLNEDGSFTFTPNPGFNGPSTTFTYLVCDAGNAPMCSNIATVTITFPVGGFLPASITDISANYTNNAVAIKWTSNFEVNSDRFEIERSTDGINFKTIGSVAAQGNSTIKHDYSFTDEVRNSTSSKNDLYYRLKLVDRDTKSTYSKVLVVRVYKTKTIQALSVTPNPAVNDIKVNAQLNEAAMVVIKVMNNNGTEVMRKNVRGAAGNNNITLEGTSNLKTGIYILEVIINSNERMTVKLMKQ